MSNQALLKIANHCQCSLGIFIENFQLTDEGKRKKQVEDYLHNMFMKGEDGLHLADLQGLSRIVELMYKGSAVMQRWLPAVQVEWNGTILGDRIDIEERLLCGCIPVPKAARQVALRIVEDPMFNKFIAVMIVLSGISIAMEGPDLNSIDTSLATALVAADLFFCMVFFTECALLIVSFGFAAGPDAYLKSHAHCFDFAVVIISIVDALLKIVHTNAGWLVFLRLLRVLRVLRLLEDVKSMQVMARTIAKSIPSVAAIFGVMLGSFIIVSPISHVPRLQQHFCVH